MRKYLALDGTFQAGRSFFAAISAAYLLSKGVPLGSLATLKIIQSVTGLLSEFPTGMVADKFGRKLSLLVSLFLGAVAFAVFAVSSAFWHFAVAEGLLALCLSFWSGAYDAFAIDSLQIGANPSALNRFYHGRNVVCGALSIASGFLGGALALHGLELPYLASLAAFIAIGSWLLVSFSADPGGTASAVSAECPAHQGTPWVSFKICIHQSAGPLLLGFFLMEIALQPLIYFWQPWFQLASPALAPVKLGSVYVIFQLAVIAASALFARLSAHEALKTHAAWIVAWTGFSLCMLVIGSLSGFWGSILVFTAAEVFFTVGESTMKAHFNKMVDPRYRASCLSIVGLVVRLGSLLSLAGIRYGIGGPYGEQTALRNLYSACGGLGLLFCLTLTWVVLASRTTTSSTRSVSWRTSLGAAHRKVRKSGRRVSQIPGQLSI